MDVRPPRIWDRLKPVVERSSLEDAGLGEMVHAITGAAACSIEVLDFFGDLGLPLDELWGMTEVWIGTMTRPGVVGDRGTVGPAMPGFEVALADDGELLVRGPALTPGYLNRDDATQELFAPGGWLRTGDLATIDDEGRVRIVDRKKEMIITSGGHNTSPQNVENRLRGASPVIAQACCVGEGRERIAALITINPEVAATFATVPGARSLAELTEDPGVLAEVGAGVARANARLDERERVVRHAVVADAWLPGAEMTPTMKLRRRVIHERYSDLMGKLFAGE